MERSLVERHRFGMEQGVGMVVRVEMTASLLSCRDGNDLGTK